MGYSCPVCGDPQADEVHLANHLAFTAMVRSGDHEAWLDEHVPDWAQRGDEGLADAVTDLAEGTEYPQVFEDTTGTHDHETDGSPGPLPGGAEPASPPELDEDARETLAEAREMTRERRGDGGEDTEHGDGGEE
jgi:hypothetical protein